jgi:hypothetical protein
MIAPPSLGPIVVESLVSTALAAPSTARPIAAALFATTATPAASTSDAASFFASTPSESATLDPPASAQVGEPFKPPGNDAGEEDDDMLDDVPLSPDYAKKKTLPPESAASLQVPLSPPTS